MGYVGEAHGWHYGFGAAGIGMIAGLLVFMKGMNDGVFGDNGQQPTEYIKKKMPTIFISFLKQVNLILFFDQISLF